MMVKLPEHFDKNEWFVLISMLFIIICFFSAPKIIPRSMTTTILLFFALLGLTADILIGVEYPVDFYTIMDSPKLEIFDVIVYAFNYAIYGYFFSYFIYKWNLRRLKLIIYIILWCGINTLLELISVKFNVFTYHNGWNIGFSTIAYLLIFTFCAVVVKFFSQCWNYKNLQRSLN